LTRDFEICCVSPPPMPTDDFNVDDDMDELNCSGNSITIPDDLISNAHNFFRQKSGEPFYRNRQYFIGLDFGIFYYYFSHFLTFHIFPRFVTKKNQATLILCIIFLIINQSCFSLRNHRPPCPAHHRIASGRLVVVEQLRGAVVQRGVELAAERSRQHGEHDVDVTVLGAREAAGLSFAKSRFYESQQERFGGKNIVE
jgi:hypothetical protein